MPEITTEQAGTAAAYLSDRAGITAAVLAVVCIALAIHAVWREIHCRKEREASDAAWKEATRELTEAWGRRVDQMRADIKEAFNQNDKIADKVVDVLHQLQMEVARLTARRE